MDTSPPITLCGKSKVRIVFGCLAVLCFCFVETMAPPTAKIVVRFCLMTVLCFCFAEKWPKTASGLPSTAGTTASVAFIRHGKIYIGHVGDSGIVLGYQEAGCAEWKARPLTKDHKPENAQEMMRIEQCGGKVVAKSGVPRVVWNRPRIGHQGPVRRSTPIDEIPFLAVARSLGDLWSYNSQLDEFVVSPDPDCSVIPINTSTFRCLIFGTDGLYNMLSPQVAL